MTPPRRVARVARRQHGPVFFAVFQAVFVGFITLAVIALDATGAWLGWVLLGVSVPGLGVAVLGELGARHALERADGER